MSQRSSKNARTQKQMTGDYKGMTRKGAGSFKPSRSAATTVHAVSSGKGSQKGTSAHSKGGFFKGSTQKKEAKRLERERRDREMLVTNIQLKADPRYATYRKVWWGLLGLGLAMTIVSWATMFLFPANANEPGTGIGMVSTGSLVAAYAFIISGFIFDWVKVRPMRRKAETSVRQMSDKKLATIIEQDYANQAKAKEEKETARVNKATKAAQDDSSKSKTFS